MIWTRSLATLIGLLLLAPSGMSRAATVTLEGGVLSGVSPNDTLVLPMTWRIETSETVDAWGWSIAASGAEIVAVNMNYAFGVPPAPPDSPGNVLWQAPSYSVIQPTIGPLYSNDGSLAGSIAAAHQGGFTGNGLEVLVGWVTVHVTSNTGWVGPGEFQGYDNGIGFQASPISTDYDPVSWSPPLSNSCGDGILDSLEDCDPGDPGDSSDCCSPLCLFETPSHVCRSGDFGHGCDAAEVCDGVSSACPPDGVEPAGTICRLAFEGCDATEVCDGVNNTCPPDEVEPAGTICDTPYGPCDLPELCDGVSAWCQVGIINPVPAGTLCRASTGACDPEEVCDGVSEGCPSDSWAIAGTVCRPAAYECDAAETCTGLEASCPTDLPAPDGASCEDGDACLTGDECEAGVCIAGPDPLDCTDGLACTSDVCDPQQGCLHTPIPECSYEAPGLGVTGQAVLSLLLIASAGLIGMGLQVRRL